MLNPELASKTSLKTVMRNDHDSQTTIFINVTMLITFVTKMLTIIKPACVKILNLFYREKHEQFHLREIARRTKLHEPSATRFLKLLEKEHILKSEKEGNMKKYRIQRNSESYLVFTMFDVERTEQLPSMRKEAISAYLNALPEQPIFAVLFGSTAKGTFNADSDVDILLIANKRIETKKAENEADALAGIKVSTFQMEYKEFIKEIKLKEDKVVQSAISTGYPLINHIGYYGVVFDERI